MCWKNYFRLIVFLNDVIRHVAFQQTLKKRNVQLTVATKDLSEIETRKSARERNGSERRIDNEM